MLKKILLFIILVCSGWVAMNFDYFRKNVEYEFNKNDYATTTAETLPREKMEPDTLVIDSLGIKAPVLYVDQVNEDRFQETLQRGVVHYPGTAKPGEPGNVYIFGHSSDNAWAKGKYKTVLALLPRIEIGAKIHLSNAAGEKFIYEVKEKRVVEKDDFSVLSQGGKQKKLLTLQTSYPVGTSLQRYVVIAELLEK